MHKLLFKFFGISVLSFSANIVYAGFFDGLIKDISSLPNAVVEGVIGGLTSNKSNNPSSSTNSQISSNTVNTNLLKPVVVGTNKDIIQIDNKNQLFLFNLAYLSEHDPAAMSGDSIIGLINSAKQNSANINFDNFLNAYAFEPNTFKKQAIVQQIQNYFVPYYQGYRGYSKVVVTKSVNGPTVESSPAIQHYNPNIPGFTLNVCGMIDNNSRKFLMLGDHSGFILSNNNHYNIKQLDYCDLKVTDINLAKYIEDMLSSEMLTGKHVTITSINQVVPFWLKPQTRYGFQFKPIQEQLQIIDPKSGKIIYSKQIL